MRVENDSDIVECLRDEYDAWIKTLTTEEIKAIRKYTQNSVDNAPNRFFERLNAMLRGSKSYAEEDMLAAYADIISGAIQKTRLSQNIICFRGTDNDPTETLVPGDEFVINQFTSTTVIDSKKFSGKYQIIIFAPEGTRGAYIEQVSAYPKQREFLLDRGIRCRVVYRRKNTVVWEVLP